MTKDVDKKPKGVRVLIGNLFRTGNWRILFESMDKKREIGIVCEPNHPEASPYMGTVIGKKEIKKLIVFLTKELEVFEKCQEK